MARELEKASVPRATDSGELKFGDIRIECHVLDNGTRLITQRGVVAALSGGRESGDLARYIDRIPNKPDGLELGPIPFRPAGRGPSAHGLRADQFVQLVALYVQASDDGSLQESQEHIADRCRRIGYALMGVGITALIDEATGYQVRRKKDALDEKLAAYMLPEPGAWECHFPREFYAEFARVYRIAYDGGPAPAWGAGFAHRYVYESIDSDVARELRRVNPNPRFGSNHHQHLSPRAQRVLDEHIRKLLVVLRGSRDAEDFKRRFDHEFRGAWLQTSF